MEVPNALPLPCCTSESTEGGWIGWLAFIHSSVVLELMVDQAKIMEL